MLEFTCECGRKLKVSNDLAGWQTKCPGCKELIPVPDPNAAPPVETAGRAPAQLPWKGIAIGASAAALLAIIIAIASAGGSAAPEDETEVARLKRQLQERDREIGDLTEERAKHGDPAKLEERARLAEEKSDRMRRDLDGVRAELADLRRPPRKTEPRPDPAATPDPEPTDPPPTAGKEQEDLLATPEQILARCSGAVVLVTSDRDSGGGFFIHADGLVVTSYRAIAQSEVRTVTYVAGEGNDRERIEKSAAVVAIDSANDLALVKIAVPQLVPVVKLEDTFALGVEQELTMLGNPVPGTRSIDHSLLRGKVVDIWSPAEGKPFIKTTIPINTANAGVPVFNVMGRVIGVSTLAKDPAEVAGLAVPAAKVTALLEGRETTFAVRGSLAEWEAEQIAGSGSAKPQPPKEHPTGIGVGGVITCFFVDEERDRVVGLDVENRCVVVMSLSKRKIVRTIPTGQDARDLQRTVNPDVFWVSHPDSRNILKIDVVEGKVYDRLDTTTRFSRFVATRNHIWTCGVRSDLFTLKDKVGFANPVTFGALAYDRRRDELIGLVTNWESLKIVELDPDKVGPLLREIGEITAEGRNHARYKDLPDLAKELQSKLKSWPIPSRYDDWAPIGESFAIVADGSLPVFLNRFGLKRDKMDSVVANYPVTRLARTSAPGVFDALRMFPYLDQIQGASPDGRWVASGKHIFNLKTGVVHLELPIPTPDSEFSDDSRLLYIYDVHARAIVPVEIEPKEKK